MFLWSLAVIFFSVLTHLSIDHIVKSSKYHITKTSTSQCKKKLDKRLFVWRNTIISLCHAIVTGTWAILAICLEPELSVDLINFNSTVTVSLVAYSVGYFIFDSLHMFKNNCDQSTIEFLIHHLIVLLCFSSSLIYEKYVGYAVVSLLAEISSIFLHTRRLLNFMSIPKRSPLFMLICFANIATFVIFRFVVLCWMTRWLVINRDNISLAFYCLGAIGLATLMVMNIGLFIRIVYADVWANTPAAEVASLVASAGSSTIPGSKNLALHIPSTEGISNKLA